VSQADLLFSTSECFKAGKGTSGKLQSLLPSLDAAFLSMSKDELSELVKVCVGNSIYVQKLKQLIESRDLKSDIVGFEFSTNCDFCTIKLN
jgi:hypothetical protein